MDYHSVVQLFIGLKNKMAPTLFLVEMKFHNTRFRPYSEHCDDFKENKLHRYCFNAYPNLYGPLLVQLLS